MRRSTRRRATSTSASRDDASARSSGRLRPADAREEPEHGSARADVEPGVRPGRSERPSRRQPAVSTTSPPPAGFTRAGTADAVRERAFADPGGRELRPPLLLLQEGHRPAASPAFLDDGLPERLPTRLVRVPRRRPRTRPRTRCGRRGRTCLPRAASPRSGRSRRASGVPVGRSPRRRRPPRSTSVTAPSLQRREARRARSRARRSVAAPATSGPGLGEDLVALAPGSDRPALGVRAGGPALGACGGSQGADRARGPTAATSRRSIRDLLPTRGRPRAASSSRWASRACPRTSISPSRAPIAARTAVQQVGERDLSRPVGRRGRVDHALAVLEAEPASRVAGRAPRIRGGAPVDLAGGHARARSSAGPPTASLAAPASSRAAWSRSKSGTSSPRRRSGRSGRAPTIARSAASRPAASGSVRKRPGALALQARLLDVEGLSGPQLGRPRPASSPRGGSGTRAARSSRRQVGTPGTGQGLRLRACAASAAASAARTSAAASVRRRAARPDSSPTRARWRSASARPGRAPAPLAGQRPARSNGEAPFGKGRPQLAPQAGLVRGQALAGRRDAGVGALLARGRSGRRAAASSATVQLVTRGFASGCSRQKSRRGFGQQAGAPAGRLGPRQALL